MTKLKFCILNSIPCNCLLLLYFYFITMVTALGSMMKRKAIVVLLKFEKMSASGGVNINYLTLP